MLTGWSDGGQGRLRASHADRRAVSALLRAARREGRLDAAEFGLRTDAVAAAGTRADLVRLTTDLPARPPAHDWVDEWRLRDIDRAQATGWLAAAVAAGRLTVAEFEQRAIALVSVTDYRGLGRVLAGLPGPPGVSDHDLLPARADREAASAAVGRAVADGRVEPADEPVLTAAIRRARRTGDLTMLVASLAGRPDAAARARSEHRLDAAYHAGRLDLAERRRRADQVRGATTLGRLDELTADLGASGERRLGDDDRWQAVELLRTAVNDGRLDLAAFEQRVDAALAAGTDGDLAPVLDDLYPPPRARRPGPADVFFDRAVVNSAVLPPPRGASRLVSKPAWKVAVAAVPIGYLAGIPIFGAQDVLPYHVAAPVLGVTALIAYSGFVTGWWEPEVEQRTAVLLAELGERVAALPGVRKASVARESRRTRVRLEVEPGVPTAPLADEVMRVLWSSPLRPLRAVHLTFGDGQESILRVSGLRAHLRHRYGPRPTGPAPDGYRTG